MSALILISGVLVVALCVAGFVDTIAWLHRDRDESMRRVPTDDLSLVEAPAVLEDIELRPMPDAADRATNAKANAP